MLELEGIEFYDVYHLPIIKAHVDRIQLVNTINRLVPSRMEIAPGTLVLAMVLDALSGRHPLYRIYSFYKNNDTEFSWGNQLMSKSSQTITGMCQQL